MWSFHSLHFMYLIHTHIFVVQLRTVWRRRYADYIMYLKVNCMCASLCFDLLRAFSVQCDGVMLSMNGWTYIPIKYYHAVLIYRTRVPVPVYIYVCIFTLHGYHLTKNKDMYLFYILKILLVIIYKLNVTSVPLWSTSMWCEMLTLEGTRGKVWQGEEGGTRPLPHPS